MNDLTALTKLRHDATSELDLGDARRKLDAEIASYMVTPTTGRTTTSSRRRLLVVAAAGLAVITVAAAVTVAATRGSRTDRSVVGRSSQLPTPTTEPTLQPVGRADSATQLVAFATAIAQRQPANPSPHQWIYMQTLSAASSAGTTGFLHGAPDERVTRQAWTRVDGKQIAFKLNGKVVTESGQTPGGWPKYGYAYLDSLPSDPQQLKAVIQTNLRAQNHVTGYGQQGLFAAIQDLMQNTLVPPTVRANLYGVLVSLPIVHFDRSVTDLAGRHGLGLYVVQQHHLKDEIVINPKTYSYMGDQYVVMKDYTVNATDGTTHFTKGQVLGWNAITRTVIVNHAGDLPSPH